MEALGIPTQVYATETTIVDPTSQEMIIKSRNLTGSSLMVIEETCTYSQHPENESWTQYRQEATIKSFLPVLSKTCENYSLASVSRSSGLGLSTIETLCQQIQRRGVTSLLDQLPSLNSSVLRNFETVNS